MRALIITICAIFISVCFLHADDTINSGAACSNENANLWNYTDWSDELDGLKFRIKYNDEYDYNSDIHLILEIESQSDVSISDVGNWIKDIKGSFLAVTFINPKNGYEYKHWIKEEFNKICIIPQWDENTYNPVLITRVELFVAQNDSTPWFGYLAVSPFDINIVNLEKYVTLDTLQFDMPKKYYLDDRFSIKYDSSDMETISVPYPANYVVSKSISYSKRNVGIRMGMGIPSQEFSAIGSNYLSNSVYENKKAKIVSDVSMHLNIGQFKPNKGYLENENRILWQRRYSIDYTLDEYKQMLSITKNDFDYLTFRVPNKVRIIDNMITWDDRSEQIIETKVEKGCGLITLIKFDDKKPTYFKGPPRKNLSKLPAKLTANKALHMTICVYEVDSSRYHENTDKNTGLSNDIWQGDVDLILHGNEFEIEIRRKRPQESLSVWRQVRVPGGLVIDENGNIVSDTLDYITIDYLKPDDRFTFFNLVINNKENYYFPTEFPVKFPKIDIQKYPDSPLECILFLSNIPSEDFSALNGKPQHAFWRKTYKIVIPDYLEMAQ